MALYNTTDNIDSSIYLKSKFPKNMVGDNYYIETLQEKVDAEWEYRTNVIDLDEEMHRQTKYSPTLPKYTPIECTLKNVYSETGQKLSDDWKKIAFRNLKHPVALGKRYRFSLDLPKNIEWTEEEKVQKSMTWLTVNLDSTAVVAHSTIRACNGSVAFVGSPTSDYKNITEIHYEPCVIDADFKMISVYYSLNINLPSAEIYLTMQYNYYTQFIKLMDRFVIGPANQTDTNNSIFKVTAISRFDGHSTFYNSEDTDFPDVPLIVLALNKDSYNSEDDLEQRVAVQAPIYPVPINEDIQDLPSIEESENNDSNVIPEDNQESNDIPKQEDVYKLKIQSSLGTSLLVGDTTVLTCELLKNNEVVNCNISYSAEFTGTCSKPALYYTISKTGTGVYELMVLRAFLRGDLKIDFTATIDDKTFTENILINLGGNY